MDMQSLAMANALVGNPPGMAAIEFVNLGGSFMCRGGCLRLALVGADCALSIDDVPIPPRTSAILEEGQTAQIGHTRSGTFAYLSVAGGFGLKPQLGSLSFHLRSRLGGLKGAPLRAGDHLPCTSQAQAGAPMHLSVDFDEGDRPIRVMLGPQDEYFTPEAIRTFLESEFTVTPQADRMGFQLSGPALEHAKGFNIVSDGIATGHVQVPGNGQPIVLMRDRQTAGGYPKIATVISADLDRFAQVRSGSPVRFSAVGRDEAVAAARALKGWIASLPDSLTPVRFSLTTEHLLSTNLIGGAVDALAPGTSDTLP
jgi:biotin-dependent carboxylase-like uncharacterized protein